MSDIATYTFLPWTRQGIANRISGTSGQRAVIDLDIALHGARVEGGGRETRQLPSRQVEIYGPGDIVGLDPRNVIRTEPKDWVTNFEPNYMACIEFYDEDLPWRYTPTTVSGHRLDPWISLIVLAEGEFRDGQNAKERPLPYLLPLPGQALPLPPSDQAWAWAHVHVSKNLIGAGSKSEDTAAIEASLAATLGADADAGYSRLLCPRRLEPNKGYHAFVVPSFEAGRLAGLGQDPGGAPDAAAKAWSAASSPSELPYYFRWYFRTGTIGDFEYLVRLLDPRPIDSRVGVRDIDVQVPGANIRGILDPPASDESTRLGGVLKLGGALRIPRSSYEPAELAVIDKYEGWATLPQAQVFRSSLAAFVNLTDDYTVRPAQEANDSSAAVEPEQPTGLAIAGNPDPLITAPLYGRWHALTQRLLRDRDGAALDPNDNWVHELNLDPRWRTAAGFGTGVIIDNQEDYMLAAWEQVGDVLKARVKIRQAQVAKEAATHWHATQLAPSAGRADKWLTVSAPLHNRVLSTFDEVKGGAVVRRTATVATQIDRSRVPRAVFSTGVRKVLRPRGPVAKRLELSSAVHVENLATRMNADPTLTAAPPVTPPPVFDVPERVTEILQQEVPALANAAWLVPWLRALQVLCVVLFLLLLAVGLSWLSLLSLSLIFAAGLLRRAITEARRRQDVLQSAQPKKQTPEAVESWPKSSTFVVAESGPGAVAVPGETDSAEFARFKEAARDVFTLVQASLKKSQPQVKPSLDLPALGKLLYEALDPKLTIPRWTLGTLAIPGFVKDEQLEAFTEVMHYPRIDVPMYRPLVQRSAELFLPNLNFIAQNSISLLETNQKFIEAYMVGLNHEFSRELLWREYPTDQRGSYFRQFWEPASFHGEEDLDAEERRERLLDIFPLHLWRKRSKLGDHDNRELAGQKEEEVVLVIRGELLKKYPNAVIYAQRAVWQDADGELIVDPSSGQEIDPTKPRDLMPLDSFEASPPRELVKTPLYEAKVDPDIYFFGFDLTVCKAQGGPGKVGEPMDQVCQDEGVAWDDPGWFFVIKERPGEPRFGLDIPADDGSSKVDGSSRVEVWNDLSWSDVRPAVAAGDFLQINAQTRTITATQPLDVTDSDDTDAKQEQQDADAEVVWSTGMSSAELAYVLYQVPVLVAVHATEMLPPNGPATGSS